MYMSMEILPLPGWVLIKPIDEVKKLGILDTPDSAQDKELMRGKVVAIGGAGLTNSGATIQPPAKISAGDTVIYKKYGDHAVEVENTEYRLVHLENLMAVIKN